MAIMVHGSGLMVNGNYGSWFRVNGSRLRIKGSWFTVHG